MKIDLLRHGETQAGHCFLGSTDARLNESGWQQMKKAVVHTDYQKIISSPLKRCNYFAQWLGEDQQIPIEISHGLGEIHFGDWEEKTTDELWQSNKQQLSAFWEDPKNNMPPRAENLVSFQKRVNAAFEQVIASNKKYEHILLIGHGGVIRQILAEMLSISYVKAQLIQVDYAGITRVNCFDGYSSIQFINKTSCIF